jgi:hypothetical protein
MDRAGPQEVHDDRGPVPTTYGPSEYMLKFFAKGFPKSNYLQANNGVEVRWRRGARHAMPDIDSGLFARATHVAMYRDQKLIGGAKFNELWITRNEMPMDLDGLFLWCDAESQSMCELAEGVRSAYKEFGFGDGYEPGEIIVEFAELRMDYAHARSAEWAEPMNRFIDRCYGRSGLLLLLRPFPLDYTNQIGDDGSDRRLRFLHRKAAMIRHYRRLLNVQVVDDTDDKGWREQHVHVWMAKPLQ